MYVHLKLLFLLMVLIPFYQITISIGSRNANEQRFSALMFSQFRVEFTMYDMM